METQTCKRCNIEQSLNDFYRSTWHKNGRLPICKKCRLAQRDYSKERKKNLEYKARNRDVILQQMWEKQIWKRFALTPEDYDRMYEQQDGVCAICGEPETFRKLAVDHCHDTGKVRGLLCSPCNLALGTFHTAELASRASQYLLSPPGKPT